jgi:hypothetical protein
MIPAEWIEKELAMCEKAEPGPWSYLTGVEGEIDLCEVFCEAVTKHTVVGTSCVTIDEAEFIIHARTGYPKALAALQRSLEWIDSCRCSSALEFKREIEAILNG